MEANLDLIDRYGLPLVILSLIALGVWRVWRFVRPFIRDTLQEHVQLIKELRDGTRVNTLSLKKQSDAMSAHAEALMLNTAFLRKIYDSISLLACGGCGRLSGLRLRLVYFFQIRVSEQAFFVEF